MHTIALLMWIGFVPAQAGSVDALGGEPRVVDLIDDTERMSQAERVAYLQALVTAGREPAEVADALRIALSVTRAGGTYDEALEAARAPLLAPEGLEARPITVPVGVRSFSDSDLSPEALAALREYRTRHYAIQTETHTSGGGTRVWSSPSAWGGVVVTRDPITTTRTWAVYRAGTRLDVPQFLALAGEDERHDALVQRIVMKRWLGRVYYGAAAAGMAGVITGAIGFNATENPEKQERWARVGVTGLGVAVVGLIGGSLPTASASRLRTDYAMSNVDIGTAQDVVDARNEEIRVELGVSPDQALSVDEYTHSTGW